MKKSIFAAAFTNVTTYSKSYLVYFIISKHVTDAFSYRTRRSFESRLRVLKKVVLTKRAWNTLNQSRYMWHKGKKN